VPTFRSDLDSIPTYKPGKPIEEVSRELGITDIAKLASNECPLEPFPEVLEAIAAAGRVANRYPEDSGYPLVQALAAHHDLPADYFWLGLGSTQLLTSIALAVGGPGTSAVYADPSFIMYPIASRMAATREIAVPLDGDMRHDLGAMLAAIGNQTTVVYVCNPNNPSATYVRGADIRAFIDAVPTRVTVVVDEAYHEYVTASDHETMLPLVRHRDNVIVTRTFSKVYGLAGLRIGYAMGDPDTIAVLRRCQIPFSANAVAQAAALAALPLHDRVADRVKVNTVGRDTIEAGLAERGLEHWPSQTNFVLFRPGAPAEQVAEALMGRGVIVRPMGGFIRVSVGTEHEVEMFLNGLDAVAT
jgi:histidinol-phosphate aminotransferase